MMGRHDVLRDAARLLELRGVDRRTCNISVDPAPDRPMALLTALAQASMQQHEPYRAAFLALRAWVRTEHRVRHVWEWVDVVTDSDVVNGLLACATACEGGGLDGR